MTYTRPSETHQTFHPNGFVTFHTPTNTYMVIVKNIYMECLASRLDRWVECSRPVAMSYSHRRSTGALLVACEVSWSTILRAKACHKRRSTGLVSTRECFLSLAL